MPCAATASQHSHSDIPRSLALHPLTCLPPRETTLEDAPDSEIEAVRGSPARTVRAPIGLLRVTAPAQRADAQQVSHTALGSRDASSGTRGDPNLEVAICC